MSKLKQLVFFLSVFAALSSFNTEALPDKLKLQLELYLKNNPSSTLYLHLDKNNYSPNERLWFKAYVLRAGVADNEVIYVRIIDEDKKIVLRRQFKIYDVRAHGDFLLPETLKEGKYILYAYTDRMINFRERDVFVQPLTIRRDAEKMLEAHAFVTDTAQLIKGGKVQVTIRIKEGIHLLKGVRGHYLLLAGNETIKSGRITTNTFGEAFINFTYPQLPDTESVQVKATFRNEKEYAEISLNLRHEGNKSKINLYPEGGNFIDGIPCKTVVEITDVNNNPVIANLMLMNGSSVMLNTKTNSQGLAVINFTPQVGADYKMQLLSSGKKTIVSLAPRVDAAGYSLSISKRKTNIQALIKNKHRRNSAFLVLRSTDMILWSHKITLDDGDSLKVPFVLDSLPKTVLSLAVFDSLGQPVAERVFLSKAREDYHLEVKTNTKIYGQRKKVTMTFNARDASDNPVEANLSVAVVERNAITPSTYRNILHSYYYAALEGNLNHFVSDLPNSDLDNLLITKKWWSGWNKVASYVPKGPVKILPNTSGLIGLVKQTTKGKFDVKYVTLRSVKYPLIGYAIPVGDDHFFSINAEQLLIDDDDELYIKTSAAFNSAYEIVYFTPERAFDKKITSGETLFYPTSFNSFMSRKPTTDRLSLRRTIQLKEVKIGVTASVFNHQTGDCTDFVCAVNILNCTGQHNSSSVGSFSPVPGGRYRYRNTIITYYGCDDYRFKSISKPKKFELPDFEKDSMAAPTWGTTIFWEPNTGTAKNGENSLSFFTSDLAGDFIIMAQGIDSKTLQPLYGSTTFSVK